MAPRKDSDDTKKARKTRVSKDYAAFLIILPAIGGDVAKAQELVKALRADKIF